MQHLRKGGPLVVERTMTVGGGTYVMIRTPKGKAEVREELLEPVSEQNMSRNPAARARKARSLGSRQQKALDEILEDAGAEAPGCVAYVVKEAPWYAEHGTMHYDAPHVEALFECAHAYGSPANWKALEDASDESVAEYFREKLRSPSTANPSNPLAAARRLKNAF